VCGRLSENSGLVKRSGATQKCFAADSTLIKLAVGAYTVNITLVAEIYLAAI
jgi:hypothetical protein